jgi:hypothetical protein
MSAQAIDPDDDPTAGRDQQPLSALEDAVRAALATAAREQVLYCIAKALPVEADPGSRPGGTHGDRAQRDKVEKVSVSMPAGLVSLIRARAGAGGFSRYVTDAVQARIKHDMLGELLDELEGEYGPVPAEVREQTRQMWPDHADS